MNPFERFQDLKSKILEDRVLIDNLQLLAFSDKVEISNNSSLVPLGSGHNNYHFRLGSLNAVWIASRKSIRKYDSHALRCSAENYISELVYCHTIGKRVPSFCGGVKVEKNGVEDYFLLVEDLTRGGNSNFNVKNRWDSHGILDGKIVYFDFEEVPWGVRNFKYMVEDKMIFIKK